MRAKRSKDKRLVDKFSKQRVTLAAESRLHQPVKSTTTANDDFTNGADENEDDMKARSSHASVVETKPLQSLEPKDIQFIIF